MYYKYNTMFIQLNFLLKLMFKALGAQIYFDSTSNLTTLCIKDTLFYYHLFSVK